MTLFPPETIVIDSPADAFLITRAVDAAPDGQVPAEISHLAHVIADECAVRGRVPVLSTHDEERLRLEREKARSSKEPSSEYDGPSYDQDDIERLRQWEQNLERLSHEGVNLTEITGANGGSEDIMLIRDAIVEEVQLANTRPAGFTRDEWTKYIVGAIKAYSDKHLGQPDFYKEAQDVLRRYQGRRLLLPSILATSSLAGLLKRNK